MALMTQSDCDAVLEFKATKVFEVDGTTFKHWSTRFVNANGVHDSFDDTDSASNASAATLKTNAHAIMKANCEMKGAPVSTSGEEKDLLI